MKKKNSGLNHDEKDNNKTLFAFYTMAKSERWEYKKMPKTWYWVGSGSTSACNSTEKKKYQREEQFGGPAETFEKMKKYLEDFFTKLKKNGIILNYKIVDHYIYN